SVNADRIVSQHMLSKSPTGIHSNGGVFSSATTIDLAQPATDMASIFQKLRLIKESQQHQQQMTPVYNA
ncbi:hypothetical protein GGI21_005858, partial [Coemansia aciculifera]